jgi:tetratricopeptide (TPR) repeat protein
MGCEWTNCPRLVAYLDLALRIADHLGEFSDRLPERDRDLLRARALRARGNPEAIAALETFVNRFPAEVAGWYELGEAYFHLGPRAPIPLSRDRSRAPFRRALELDPGFVTSYAHLFTDAFVRDDSASLAELIREHRTVDTTAYDLKAAEIAAGLRWGDSLSRSRALEQAESADESLSDALGVYGISSPELGRRMPREHLFIVERSLVHTHAGQPDSAWLAAAYSEDPLSESGLRLVAHLQGLPSAHGTRELVTVLGPSSDPWAHFLLGALAVQEDRWDGVRRELDWLTAATRGMDPGSYGAAAAHALEAYAEARRSDVSTGVDAMERLMSDPAGFGYVTTEGLITTTFVHGLLRQELGRLLLSSGRLEEAERYFDSLTYPIWELNVGLAEACLGEVHERLGEPELAARHYRRLAWWWQNGEPPYRAVAEQGRLAATRLEEYGVNGSESATTDGLCERAFSPEG